MENLQDQSACEKIMTVECSPNTANVLRKYPGLYSELLSQSEEATQQVQIEDDFFPLNNNLIFPNNEENTSSNKAVWLDSQCQCLLIEVYKEIRPKLGKQVDVKNKKKMWAFISKKLNEKGHNFTAFQVESKWKSLERSFKKKTSYNKKTGRERATCSFDKELSEVMIKSPSVIPPFLLGSHNEGRKNNEILIETGVAAELGSGGNQVNESSGEIASHLEEDVISPNNTSKRVSSVAREIRLWREERAAEKDDEKEERRAYSKEKLRAYEERTNETRRKNDILEGFLKCFQEREK